MYARITTEGYRHNWLDTERITWPVSLVRHLRYRRSALRLGLAVYKTAALPTELRQPAAECTAQLRRDGRTKA
jgi:hypothetical protein